MLSFHRLVAGRYFTHGTHRSARVFLLSLVITLVLLATVAINLFLLHAHSVRVQEFRAERGQIFQLAQLILIVAWVLVTFFTCLISRLTIFTTISVFGLFLGTGALVIVLSVMSGFEQDLKKKILGTNAHIVVTETDSTFTDFQAVRDRIARVPGVIGASPYLENEVMIASQSNLSGVVVKGIDPATVGQVTDLPRTIEIGGLEYLTNPDKLKLLGGPPIFDDDKKDKGKAKDEPAPPKDKDTVKLVPEAEARRMLDDSLPARPTRPGVIIGRELAKNLRLYPGDDVNIISPFGGIGPSGAIPKSKPFRIAGIFFSGMFEYDTKFVYLALPAAQKFFDQTGQATGIEAKVANADETEPVVARIQAALGGKYEVRDWKDLNKSLFSALKIEKILMFVLLCFIILVAAFSIIANGTMLVMEKGREIAILKAMGASDGGILGTFLLLGLFIGALGTLTGMVAGVLGCLALARFGLPLNPDVYYITTLPVKLNGYEIAAVAVAALAIALGATLYPAWMAARLRPVEGLRDAQR
jgi:lipoprotein-releasing system permease protein